MASKKFLFVNRKAPYGTVYALEALEVVLIAGAFEQQVSLAFLDDGVYQLLKNQRTTELGVKNFSPIYRALGDYDITRLYVEIESLQERGLSVADLLPVTYDDVEDDFRQKSSLIAINREEMAVVMADHDIILSF